MIDPRELRLGNYVLSDGGAYCQVGGIPCTDRDEWAEHLHPIPLTEDILEKCKMRIDNNGGYRSTHIECGILTLYADNTDNFSTLRSSHDRYTISYLHELQNLFYDLTKTELNVRL